jgi:TrmH family RNA methyltransferase
MEVTSVDNPLVKRLVTLASATGRRAEGLFLAEGSRLIDGLLAAGWTPAHLLVREGLTVPDHWPVVTRVSERVAVKLSQAATASGFCAAFPLPQPPPLEPSIGGIVLAGVADPGNVGTLIRSAAAFGIRQVVLCGGADPFGSKVVQATAGALALVHLYQVAEPEVLAGGAPCCGLVVTDGVPPTALARGPRWLVVGGEANGLPDSWLAACAERLTLPMPGGTESLNAAIAGSIAAYLLSVGAA